MRRSCADWSLSRTIGLSRLVAVARQNSRFGLLLLVSVLQGIVLVVLGVYVVEEEEADSRGMALSVVDIWVGEKVVSLPPNSTPPIPSDARPELKSIAGRLGKDTADRWLYEKEETESDGDVRGMTAGGKFSLGDSVVLLVVVLDCARLSSSC